MLKKFLAIYRKDYNEEKKQERAEKFNKGKKKASVEKKEVH